MADINEIPTLVSELADMSKRYLQQETIEPAKRLGRFAGMGVGAGALWMFAALFAGLGVYAGLVAVLPDGEWFVVLARFLTVLVTGGVAGMIVWRLTIPIEAPRPGPRGAGS